LANLSRFLQFLYHFNREEILHATIIKFITSPDLCAHLTVWCELNQSFVNHANDNLILTVLFCCERKWTFL